ncbi:hypothetical protein [Acanthopleuribacter pedis]|uniref:Uncharacterized protein n=1 Tax=Acanthopleuribacter pedis TaxID=442870 RepID=A0A8J7Q606_9BACT|nr:hypothetical protein [Acanthopleuribacter pedis]MBO1317369.1 hypothetical protein [Acanthopleuribacter pedis]MBO1318676.1 hypothetical protein [Acanthopleuribacter pedis]
MFELHPFKDPFLLRGLAGIGNKKAAHQEQPRQHEAATGYERNSPAEKERDQHLDAFSSGGPYAREGRTHRQTMPVKRRKSRIMMCFSHVHRPNPDRFFSRVNALRKQFPRIPKYQTRRADAGCGGTSEHAHGGQILTFPRRGTASVLIKIFINAVANRKSPEFPTRAGQTKNGTTPQGVVPFLHLKEMGSGTWKAPAGRETPVENGLDGDNDTVERLRASAGNAFAEVAGFYGSFYFNAGTFDLSKEVFGLNSLLFNVNFFHDTFSYEEVNFRQFAAKI